MLIYINTFAAMPHQKMKTFQKVIKYLFQFSERTRFMSVLHPSQFSFWIQAHDKKIVFPKKKQRGTKCWGKVFKIPYQNKISQGRISSHKYMEREKKGKDEKSKKIPKFLSCIIFYQAKEERKNEERWNTKYCSCSCKFHSPFKPLLHRQVVQVERERENIECRSENSQAQNTIECILLFWNSIQHHDIKK